jgi:hypothetical protein
MTAQYAPIAHNGIHDPTRPIAPGIVQSGYAAIETLSLLFVSACMTFILTQTNSRISSLSIREYGVNLVYMKMPSSFISYQPQVTCHFVQLLMFTLTGLVRRMILRIGDVFVKMCLRLRLGFPRIALYQSVDFDEKAR